MFFVDNCDLELHDDYLKCVCVGHTVSMELMPSQRKGCCMFLAVQLIILCLHNFSGNIMLVAIGLIKWILQFYWDLLFIASCHGIFLFCCHGVDVQR